MRYCIVLALALLSCRASSPTTRREQLIEYTREFEARMGVGRHDIMFIERGQESKYEWCAYSGGYLAGSVLGYLNPPPPAWVTYDLNKRCDVEDPREMALHEVCHHRMRHHEMAELMMSDPHVRYLMEQEAEECASWYR